MAEVVQLPIRHRRRTKQYGSFVFMFVPWEAGNKQEVMDGLTRVMELQLGTFFPGGKFVIQVGDVKDMEREFDALQRVNPQ